MAMQFIDGFDYYNASQIGRKWDTFNSATFGTGVYGTGKAVQGPNVWIKNVAAIATGFVGFHLFVGSGFSSAILFAFRDGGTTQVDLRLTAGGALQLTRNGTVLGTTSNLVAGNTWYWVELKATINSTTGVAEIHVNGSSWLALSSQNTQATANASFNQLALGGGNNSTNLWDSFHFWDTTGTLNNGYIGEHEVLTTLPNAVGTNSAWTKGGTTINTNNYQQVDEANADDDATYVASNTAGQIDSYGFAAISQASGGIAAVAINTVDRVDDASPHVIHHYWLSTGTAAESADISPSSGYNNHQSIRETDPHTSAAWTISGLNAAEKGVKLVS